MLMALMSMRAAQTPTPDGVEPARLETGSKSDCHTPSDGGATSSRDKVGAMEAPRAFTLERWRCRSDGGVGEAYSDGEPQALAMLPTAMRAVQAAAAGGDSGAGVSATVVRLSVALSLARNMCCECASVSGTEGVGSPSGKAAADVGALIVATERKECLPL